MKPPGKIIVTTAHFESRMSPTVIAGQTDDGSTIYARYRWGRLVIRLDPRDPPPHGGAVGAWIMDRQLDPTGLAGFLDYADLREITAEIIDWPDEITPRTYDESEATIFPEDVG